MNASNNPSVERLPLSEMHAAAWAEYNTRISARHSISQMYMTASTVLLGSLFVTDNETLRKAAAFLLPSAAIVQFTLLWMHDEIMGNLHAYMRRCEQIGALNADNLPCYHCEKPWSEHLLRWRVLQNSALLIASLVFLVGGLVGTYKILNPFEILFYSLFGVAAIVFNFTGYFRRRALVKATGGS